MQARKRVVSLIGAGRVATEPRVTVSEKGQLSFNKLASAALDGYALGIWFDDLNEQTKKSTKTTCQIKAVVKDAKTAKFPMKFKSIEGEWAQE